MSKIGILGAGTWGIALARMLCNSGHDVKVWSAIKAELDELSTEHTHRNLPGIRIPEKMVFSYDLCDACRDVDLLLFAVPSVYVRSTAMQARPYIAHDQVIVDVAKGIEPETLLTMTGIIADVLNDGCHNDISLVALSGPTHAEQVAMDLPTAIVSASQNEVAARFVQQVFMNTCMRVYTNPDVNGIQICGAMKNIIALACGISSGLGAGDNAKAAIITRGIEEIKRLGMAMGCNERTFSGLAGIGDLIVTATSRHSRNNQAGMLIGSGMSVEATKQKVGMVIEGINALPAAMELAERYCVQMPIVQAVYQVVKENVPPKSVMLGLMRREKKMEW